MHRSASEANLFRDLSVAIVSFRLEDDKLVLVWVFYIESQLDPGQFSVFVTLAQQSFEVSIDFLLVSLLALFSRVHCAFPKGLRIRI